MTIAEEFNKTKELFQEKYREIKPETKNFNSNYFIGKVKAYFSDTSNDFYDFEVDGFDINNSGNIEIIKPGFSWERVGVVPGNIQIFLKNIQEYLKAENREGLEIYNPCIASKDEATSATSSASTLEIASTPIPSNTVEMIKNSFTAPLFNENNFNPLGGYTNDNESLESAPVTDENITLANKIKHFNIIQ